MKATFAILTCAALVSNVAARKVGKFSRSLETVEVTDTWCDGNIAPSTGPFEIGMSNELQVVRGSDLTNLREVLKADPYWTLDHVWQFKAKVTSGFNVTTKFGMIGGQGFLHFDVPPGPSPKVIKVQGKIKTDASSVSLDFDGVINGSTSIIQHKIIFEDFCLRQLPCSEFDGCLPAAKYLTNHSAHGDTPEKCCTKIYCKETVSCDPSSKYGEFVDHETRLGNSLDLCCEPKLCSDVSGELCIGDLNPRQGSGILGSTVSECCQQKLCRDFTGCGSGKNTYKLPNKNDDGSMRVGFTLEECCTITSCAGFHCNASDLWTSKEDIANLSGASFQECCDPLYCANYSCEEPTKYVKKEHPPLQGSSDDRCCHALHCSNYTCSSPDLILMEGGKNRIGSTDEECCEAALCIHYNCSDDTKYMKKPNYVETDGVQGPLKGDSDEACCFPLYCSNFSCSSTRWKAKTWTTDNDTTLGWSHELCCEQLFCESYTCTTDYDNDGNGTKWYKRVDTNSMKWQGSTDDECCYPLYCNQYETNFSTKWKLKPFDGVPLLGSTDPECYDPIYCNSCLCNESTDLSPIANAANVQGSTIEECCENSTKAALDAQSAQAAVEDPFSLSPR